ncbi:MAG: hypothetical protein RL701_3993 [Pseudomonadota bacterium]
MDDPNTQNRQDPHSLAPIQLEGRSIERDVALIRGGQGARLTITILTLVAIGVGGARLLKAVDSQQAYAHAASQLERVDAEQSESFLRCALPNLQRSQVDTTSSLHSAIEIASEGMDKAYGTLLEECSPLLESLELAVNQINAPPDMTRKLSALSLSARNLGRAWTNYRHFLQQPNKPYDYVQAAPLIEKITLAWQDYRVARSQAKQALSAQH